MAGAFRGGNHKFGERGAARRRLLDMVAEDGTGVVAGVEIEAVLQPLLLHEFELPEQIRAQEIHDDAALARVVLQVGGIVSKGQAAPQQPAAVVERRTRPRAEAVMSPSAFGPS